MALRKFKVVVGGIDCDAQASLAEARKAARPLIAYWLRKVERAVVAKALSSTDYLVAKELANYPSANRGYSYPGRERLAAKLSRSVRTIQYSLDRLCAHGLLKRKRGGPGKSSSSTFCFEGREIFGGKSDDAIAAPEVQSVAHQEVQSVAHKPSEPQPLERNPPPTPTPESAALPNGRPITETGDAPPLEGEIIGAEISFEEFHLATGRKGSEGFARAEWLKLKRHDRLAIALRLRSGRLNTGGLWAGKWLQARQWEQPEPILVEHPSIINVWRTSHIEHVECGSPLWLAERARFVALGNRDAVKAMDDDARGNRKGRSVRLSDHEGAR